RPHASGLPATRRDSRDRPHAHRGSEHPDGAGSGPDGDQRCWSGRGRSVLSPCPTAVRAARGSLATLSGAVGTLGCASQSRRLRAGPRVGREGLRLARIAGDPAFLLEANHAMWSTSVAMGRPAEAAEYLEQGLALDEPGQRRSWWLYGTHDPRVCCRHMLAIACWLRGYPEQALKWAVEQV